MKMLIAAAVAASVALCGAAGAKENYKEKAFNADSRDKFDQVQIFPESSDKAATALSRDLRRWIGKRVVVDGTSPFGAHTGHHHAPLMLPITRIALASVPTNRTARR